MKKTKKVAKGQANKSKFDKKNSSMLSQEVSGNNQKEHNQFVKSIQIEFDEFQEIFQNVKISTCVNPVTNGLSIKKLINLLEKDFNIFAKDKLIKFYLQQGSVYISVPSSKKALSTMEIQKQDFLHNKIIKLQLLKNMQLIDVVMQNSENQSDQNGDDQDQNQNDQKILQGNLSAYHRKMQKIERKKNQTCYRKSSQMEGTLCRQNFIYSLGIENGDEKAQRVSLEEGAKIVNISKKTLDDYLSQLKKGKKYGFNFNDHKNEKIGVLREFIRKMQKKK